MNHKNTTVNGTGIVVEQYPRNDEVSQWYPVSSEFRSWFLRRFKLDGSEIAGRDLLLLRLAAFLLPGAHLDDEDGDAIVLGYGFMLRVLRPGRKGSDMNIGNLIKEFPKRFWEIEVEQKDHWNGKARRVTKQVFPLELRTQLDLENERMVGGEAVDLVTGLPWKPPSLPEGSDSPIPEVEEVRTYLNALPESLFTAIAEKVPEAITRASGARWPIEKKRCQKAILRSILANAKPLYKAVPRSSRLYAHGPNWLGLKKLLRGVLTPHLWKMDLASAQLRIAGALWGFDVSRFLVDGSVWTHLLRACGERPDNLAMKSKIKKLVYTALYGGCRHTLAADARELGHPGLLKDPLFKAVLEARDPVLDRLAGGEEFVDAWGNRLKIEPPNPGKEATKPQRKKQARSKMAAVCQSYELKLLIPVFKYAEQHPGLQIVALLHDGIYAVGDWAPHLEAIQDLVNAEAQTLLGIEVPLDCQAPEALASAPSLAA